MYDFSGIWYHIIINIVLMFMCILYIIIFENLVGQNMKITIKPGPLMKMLK